MKKLNLFIAEPCHENWEAMTQMEKGKFCSSCQKTVVDFTNMSDRQLAEFFKKPKQNLCGRFHNDQLERDILIPKKRIPWLRYFFQFTWPAFMLMLKSCGGKTNGQVIPKEKLQFEKPIIQTTYANAGMVAREIQAVDSSKEQTVLPKRPAGEKMVKAEMIVGEIEVVEPDTSIRDVEDAIIANKIMDTVTVCSYNTVGKISAIAGGISYSVSEVKPTGELIQNEIQPLSKIKAFPNPVRAGSTLNIAFDEKNTPERIEIFSASGQLIGSMKNQFKGSSCQMQIPSSVDAGLYFVKMIFAANKVRTIKVAVAR